MFKPFSASRSALHLRNTFLCALPLLPFLAIFAPHASAQSYWSLPRVEVAAGPAVTEGEPATFHVRVRPVQTEDLEVPVTVWNFGKSVLAKTRMDMTVTIPANTSQVTASVPTIDDDVDENNTYIDVTPSRTSKFRLGAGKYYDDPFSAYTRVLVKDNDPGNRPILGIHSQEPKIPNFSNHTWVSEGDTVDFTIKADEAATVSFEVCVGVTDSHGGKGDFLAPQNEGRQCVNFPAGQSSVTFSVPTVDDDVAEETDDLVIYLLGGSGYFTKERLRYVRVFDNDGAAVPVVNIPESAGATEGGSATFTLTALPRPTSDLTVRVRVTLRGNYGVATGYRNVTIPPSGTATLSVDTTDDSEDEPKGRVAVFLQAGDGYTVGSLAARSVDILDNDDPSVPQVNITASAGGTEGEAATFTLTATPAPASALVVGVTVAATGDYGVTTGARNVTIPTGGSATLTVATTDDSADEPNGTVTVTLNAGSGYTVGALSTGTADILDDDGPTQPQTQTSTDDDVPPPPTCTATSTDLVEKVRGYYELNRSRADRNHGENWLRVLIAFGVETHATLQPYTSAEARAGEPAWDGWVEIREELERLEGCGGSQETLAPPPTPEITISGGAGVTEGGDAEFTLTAAPAPASDIEVSVTVTETGSFAASGATGARTVTVGTGGTAAFTVATENDTTDEPDGSIEAAVAAGAGYTVGGSATASVAVADDDDPPVPEVNITASAGGTEGEAATFTLTATPAPASALVVGVTVAATGDYGVAAGDRDVTIPTGGSATLTVATTDDSADEPNGAVTLTLNAGNGYTVGALSTGTADILDDDAPVQPQTQTSTFAPDAQLVSDIRQWRGETQHGQAHVDRWTRVLIALGVETGTLTPMTVAEAQAFADRGWTRWERVVNEIKRKEAHDAQPVTPVTPPPALPTVTVSGNGAVTEGAGAAFTVSRTGDTATALTVLLAVSEDTSGGRDFVATNDEGNKQVVIQAESATATYTVPTSGDSVDEPDGTVTLALRTSSTYANGSPSSATVAVSDDDDPTGLPRVSIDDAEAQEGQDMVFTVRLSAPAANHAFVYVKTQESSPASATAGVDYQANHFSNTARVVIIHRGSRERQFSVQTYRDAHDDDGETFEVVVTQTWMNASNGARPLPVANGVAVGTITNDDPLPAAYLSRFGRTVAEQALDGIAGRLAAPRTPGMQGMLAGYALGAAADPGPPFDAAASDRPTLNDVVPSALGPRPPDGPAARALADLARGFGAQVSSPESSSPGTWATDPLGDPFGFDTPSGPAATLTAQEALLGSSFALTGPSDATGGSGAVWGRASQHRFDGAERGDGTAITLDGTVTTGMLGADYARGDWLVGLALTHSTSEGDYASVGEDRCSETDGERCDGAVRAGDGTVDASLTAAVPYASLKASERLTLWGAAGYGAGEVTVKTAREARYRADTDWTMAAAGIRSALHAAPPDGAGPALALTVDALWTRTASDRTTELAASESDVTRVRFGLEGRWRIAMEDDGHLTPTLELGARHDGGDAETGVGVELGGGLAWSAPALGLSLDLSGRTLIAHEDDALKDRGVSAAFVFDPTPASERGPSFGLRQDFGGRAEGGLDALFTSVPLEERTGSEAQSRWVMEAAWGVPVLKGRFTGSPHVGMGLSADARDYRLGWRLTPQAATAPDLTLGVRATRWESDTTDPAHTVGVELSVRW